jgi:hypothetical protein
VEIFGLSGSPTRQDSFFRRIFRPSEASVDADMLGQQGFWVCLIGAIVTLVTATLQGHPVIAILMGLFHFLSGIGVAAIAVAAVYLLNMFRRRIFR